MGPAAAAAAKVRRCRLKLVETRVESAWCQHLKVKYEYDNLLSSFAFKFNLRHYSKGWAAGIPLGLVLRGVSRGAVPPKPFIIVAMVATGVFLVGWRAWFASGAGGGRGLHSSTSHLNVSTFCGIRWVPSGDRWAITRHKLNTKRLIDQNGLG